ncbi:LOW QUALITY PROTEIN: POL4-like protein [Mya arenaria]|uniref:POL4-like protein n=1 Tax=Mya arenaria TaxID=6604 RepID=A0ABY7GD52_MYAAR|nr:LOW QUALITY PROTEIN: POL4-like protein [Mya arenaria]
MEFTSFNTHLEHINELFSRLKQAGLKLSSKECSFALKRFTYLGHIISKSGIDADQSKVEQVRNLRAPKDQTGVKLTITYKLLQKSLFRDIVNPFLELLKHAKPFVWSEDCQKALESLPFPLWIHLLFNLRCVKVEKVSLSIMEKRINNADALSSYTKEAPKSTERVDCVGQIIAKTQSLIVIHVSLDTENSGNTNTENESQFDPIATQIDEDTCSNLETDKAETRATVLDSASLAEEIPQSCIVKTEEQE